MLIVMWGGTVKGQRIYGQYTSQSGTTGAAGTPGGVGGAPGAAGTYITSTPTDFNDTNYANFASITATSGTAGAGILPAGGPGGASTSYMNINFPGTVLPTAQTAILIKLDVDNDSKVQVQAYNSGGGTVGAIQSFNSLPKTTAGDYIFSPSGASTAIRITVTSDGSGLLGVATTRTAKAYYAYYLDPTCSLTSYTTTNMTGVNLLSSISNPDDAIDGNMTTYSRLTAGIGVATTLHQYIYLSKLSGPQDAATVTFAIPPAFLSAGIAGSINIITYNGATEVGRVAFSGLLLGTDLLTLVRSGLPTAVSFAPGAAFNRIEISYSALVGLTTNFDIYEVSSTPAKPTFSAPSTQNLTICAGDPATLTPIPPSSGNELRWYTAMMDGTHLHTGDSYTPVPTPTADTTTYFVATRKIGCLIESERVPAKIIVRPLATVNAITGILTACIGGTTTLANTTPLGVWGSANPTIATVNTSGVVTGVTAGTATINYSVSNANGCVTVMTANVIIHLQPSIPAISDRHLCVGQSINLNTLNPADANGTTGGSYVWSASVGGAALSSTTVSPLLGNITYYLRYTKDGCSSDSSVLISTHPKPPTPHVILN